MINTLRVVAICTIFTTLHSSLAAQNNITTDSLDNTITHAIENKYFPGAQIVVGDSKGIIYSESYGYTDYNHKIEVDSATVYDLASCTKVCATTLSIMTLIDKGELTLDDHINEIIEFPDTLQLGQISVRELLHHTSGLPAGISVAFSLMKSAHENTHLLSRYKSAKNPYHYDTYYYAAKDVIYDSVYISKKHHDGNIKIAKGLYLDKDYHKLLDSMVYTSYKTARRGTHVYSDLNFYMLQKIVEKVTSTPLDKYTQQIYTKMGLSNVGYTPLKWSSIDKICPTEYEALFRRDTIHGTVHDDLACVQGGVGGNAGLFGSAEDVAGICGMLLRNGTSYNGEHIIDSTTIERFTRIEHGTKRSTYALGFTKIDNDKMPYTPESYGHSGFTGTYLWIDPTKDLYLVILTNRVHPTRTNKKLTPKLRGEIWELVTNIFDRN